MLGMKDRILSNSGFLLGEGVFILIFANSTSLTGAIVVMIFFSLSVQAAEGHTFGINPYIKPEATGSVLGIVDAVPFGICFRQLDYKSVFYIVGGCVLASAFVDWPLSLRANPLSSAVVLPIPRWTCMRRSQLRLLYQKLMKMPTTRTKQCARAAPLILALSCWASHFRLRPCTAAILPRPTCLMWNSIRYVAHQHAVSLYVSSRRSVLRLYLTTTFL